MSVSITFDESRQVIRLLAEGVVTDEDLLPALRAAYRDPRFAPTMRTFADYTGVTKFKLTGEAMRIAAEMNQVSPDTRQALLVGPDVAFGLARAHQGWNVALNRSLPTIFQDRAAALAFLNEGLPPDQHVT